MEWNSSWFPRCTVLNVTGFTSPHKDDVIDTQDHCDPRKASYVEFSDCGGAILDEQPGKMAEAIRLFLQGLGHSTFNCSEVVLFDWPVSSLVSHMSIPRFSIANRLTEQAAEYKRRNGAQSKAARRQSVPFDTADSGLYQNESADDDIPDDDTTDYGHELQLRVDSFDDRNIKL